MRLNLRQLEVFRAVMTAGSISGAAKSMFVSQPAVSKWLAYTEQSVGFPLFERIKGRLYATPEAKRLLKDVESVYVALDRVSGTISDLGQDHHGLLRLVSHSTLGYRLVPSVLKAFHEKRPQVRLHVEVSGHFLLQQRLLEQKADLGITIFPVDHPGLDVLPICSSGLVCVFPATHPLARQQSVSVADLSAYTLISYERESPLGLVVNQILDETDTPPTPGIEVSSPQLACSLANMGMGIALVDEFSARDCQIQGQVARPLEGAPSFTAAAVYRRYEPVSQLTHYFIRDLQQALAAQGFANVAEPGKRPRRVVKPVA